MDKPTRFSYLRPLIAQWIVVAYLNNFHTAVTEQITVHKVGICSTRLLIVELNKLQYLHSENETQESDVLVRKFVCISSALLLNNYVGKFVFNVLALELSKW